MANLRAAWLDRERRNMKPREKIGNIDQRSQDGLRGAGLKGLDSFFGKGGNVGLKTAGFKSFDSFWEKEKFTGDKEEYGGQSPKATSIGNSMPTCRVDYDDRDKVANGKDLSKGEKGIALEEEQEEVLEDDEDEEEDENVANGASYSTLRISEIEDLVTEEDVEPFDEENEDQCEEEELEDPYDQPYEFTGSEDEYSDDSRYDSESKGDRGKASGYARVFVPGSEAEQVKSSGFARVIVTGSQRDSGVDSGTDLLSNARVSVTESEPEPSKITDREFLEYAKVSVAGSESEVGNARVSVAGSEADYGKDSDREFSGYARVSVAGSEGDHVGTDEDRVVQRFARVSVDGSDTDHVRDLDKLAPGYARLSVAGVGSESRVGGGFGRKSAKQEYREHPGKEREFSTSSLHLQDEEDQESWNEEYLSYLEQSPEVRARLQYEVRVVLISPLFESKDKKLAAFPYVYKKKFGKDVESTGFSSTERLCRAMPNVVQRNKLQDQGQLILVDSNKNRRAVAGIRSGLRRIVYEVLQVSEGITYDQLEKNCSERIGQPLVEILTEHGYDTPSVESMIKDMSDLGCSAEAGPENSVILCTGAEDPALTDGLLVRAATVANQLTADSIDLKKRITELEKVLSERDVLISELQEGFKLQNFKVGRSLTLRGLKSEIKRFGDSHYDSTVYLEDEMLQTRLHLRVLLAFYNGGCGIQVQKLGEVYESTFRRNINLQVLGFRSILELGQCWHDIFLFQELRPDMVFLVPSLHNKRILNSLQTGLRSAVYSVLQKDLWNGLQPLDFLHGLQQAVSGELLEVLDTNGYECREPEKFETMLSSGSSSEFQLAHFEEACLLLDDMMDFVRLGSNEDGGLVIKLRSEAPPLVDLVDCKIEQSDLCSIDELFLRLMMIVPEDADTSSVENNHDEQITDSVKTQPISSVRSIIKSFENIALRSSHSSTHNSATLKNEIRLLLASPKFMENGVPWKDFINVYKERAGHELCSQAKLKTVCRGMSDVVAKESLGEDRALLSQTSKNLRVVSATRAGLRQILFWALLKNPGGIWANLLEGWFIDFAGRSLAATLQSHGYDISKSVPLYSVTTFLRDMNDLLQRRRSSYEVFTWASEVRDPIHSDAKLLGLSELEIQYNYLQGDVGQREVAR